MRLLQRDAKCRMPKCDPKWFPILKSIDSAEKPPFPAKTVFGTTGYSKGFQMRTNAPGRTIWHRRGSFEANRVFHTKQWGCSAESIVIS